MADPTSIINSTTQTVITIVQIIGACVMLGSIAIAWWQLQLQKKEVIKQNQRIIELLEGILAK